MSIVTTLYMNAGITFGIGLDCRKQAHESYGIGIAKQLGKILEFTDIYIDCIFIRRTKHRVMSCRYKRRAVQIHI